MSVATGTRILILAAFVSVLHPASARAEWQFTPFLGYTFGGATNIVDFGLVNDQQTQDDTRLNFGGSVRWLGKWPVGLEAYYVHTPGFFDAPQELLSQPRLLTSGTYAVMGNLVVATPASWNRYGLRPSLSGGIGVIHAAASDQLDVLSWNLNLLGMNLGASAVGFLSEHVGVRFDLRFFQNLTGSPDDLELPVTLGQPVRLHYWTASVGVVLKK